MYSFKESDIYTLKYVKAGKAGKIIALSQKVAEDFFNQASLNGLKEYFDGRNIGMDTFMVVGESMAPEGVHTGDLLFVTQTDEEDLKYGSLIVLKIDVHRMSKLLGAEMDLGYKLRKYLMTIDLVKTWNDAFEKVKEMDEESRFLPNADACFKKKYEAALKEIGRNKDVLLSVTYTDKGRDYSFHGIDDLYAKVDMVYRKDQKEYRRVLNLIGGHGVR